MPILQLLALQTEEGAGVTPFLVGGGALLLLLALMFAMLAFGKGREHS
jgi:predicted PurR-regulated permease PerM